MTVLEPSGKSAGRHAARRSRLGYVVTGYLLAVLAIVSALLVWHVADGLSANRAGVEIATPVKVTAAPDVPSADEYELARQALEQVIAPYDMVDDQLLAVVDSVCLKEVTGEYYDVADEFYVKNFLRATSYDLPPTLEGALNRYCHGNEPGAVIGA